MRTYTFCIVKNNLRIDILLSTLFPVLSRSFAQRLIEQKHVLINNKPITSHKIPKSKDVIMLSIPNLQQTGIIPSDIPLDILYEDTDIMVVNKPAGIVVHPTDNGGHISDTIVNALLFHCKDLGGINGNMRPGIIHRLDKDTSGVLVVAKNDTAMRYLSSQWEKREVTKEYIALVYGKISPAKGMIEAPLGRSSSDRKKMAVSTGKNSRYALTKYEVQEYIQNYSLVKVHIITGRTHQIRVHFKTIGFPVIGDQTYGNSAINSLFLKEYGLKRQFLHAYKIGFKLPSTKKRKEIEAPLPKDLQNTLEKVHKV